jgi:Helix-turn-helix domain
VVALPFVAKWRNAVRDSGMSSTTKLVGLVLSTYMSADGRCWPSKQTIADGCGLGSRRSVDRAVDNLERAGLLAISRSKGHSSNGYQAVLTAHEERGCDVSTAQVTTSNRAIDNVQPRTWDAQKRLKAIESGERRRTLGRAAAYVETHGSHFPAPALVAELVQRWPTLTEQDAAKLVDQRGAA